MDDSAYILFLIVSVALVLVDGQVIYRSGLRYLTDTQGSEQQSAKSMARMVSVLFHIAVLGLVLLISTLDVGGDSAMEVVVLKLGIVLLLLALAHFATLKMLNRMRDRLDAENLTKKRYDARGEERPVSPNPDVPVRHEPVITNDPTTPARFKAVQPGDPEIPTTVQERRGPIERPILPEKR
ncbi:hypothetical protein L6E12_31670 [Actinokineospora sp. PR83]|uniref:hypothetical protein n=1 Tax=Actinokineospora sp. PR83 TaxID=2884908 RepID=UPI001F2EBA34|nr:hypothetical protein [Actinokineospora sp. PR83]MCG8920335.1 hypothetical protein [Actinokineospora sp. PR83]